MDDIWSMAIGKSFQQHLQKAFDISLVQTFSSQREETSILVVAIIITVIAIAVFSWVARIGLLFEYRNRIVECIEYSI